MGGEGSIVEIDESFIGRKDGFEVKQGTKHKNAFPRSSAAVRFAHSMLTK
jgi:hypothetical protein